MSSKTKKTKKRKSNTGKEYERIVASIYREFGEDATITENEFIKGRQIDVAVRNKVLGNPVLIIIECKKYKRKVSVGNVDEVIGKMQDVKASIAVLVSDSGFTKGARDRAGENGYVRLVSAFNSNNPKLRARSTAPVQVILHNLVQSQRFELTCVGNVVGIRDTDAFQVAIRNAAMRFVDWFNDNRELDSGTHVHTQNFECLGCEFRLKSSLTKEIKTYIKENADVIGCGAFDLLTLAATAGSKLSIDAIDVENDPQWIRVPNDFVLKPCRLFFTRLTIMNDSTVEYYTKTILSAYD